MEVRRADIRIDLGSQALADADRAEVVMLVVRDDHLAGRHQLADLFGAEPLVLGYFDHLWGDDAFARSFKLGHVATSKLFRLTAIAADAYGHLIFTRPQRLRSHSRGGGLNPALRDTLYTPGWV